MRTLSFSIALLLLCTDPFDENKDRPIQNGADVLRSAIYDNTKDSLIVRFHTAAPGAVVIRLTALNTNEELMKDSIRVEKGDHQRAYSLSKVKGSYVLHFRSRDIFSSRKLFIVN